MFTGTKRGVGFVGWAAAAVVTLAVAAGGSAVVPSLINADGTPPAVSSASTEAAATVETPAAELAAVAPPEVVVPEVVVPEVETVVTAPPTTKAPKVVAAAAAAPAPAPVVVAPAPPPPPPVPVLAPRTVPSAAQVQSAIARLSVLVGVPAFLISPANIASGGNQVCTAFDQGQTFAQVKATGLAQVPVAVTPAAADEVVRTAVAMYCPAYASRLV